MPHFLEAGWLWLTGLPRKASMKRALQFKGVHAGTAY
jgi:hypothetical protein